jgi:hypothetical protein
MKCKYCNTKIDIITSNNDACKGCYDTLHWVKINKEAVLKILKDNVKIETASDHMIEIKIDDCFYIVCGDYFHDNFVKDGRLYHESFEVHEVYSDIGERQPLFLEEYFQDNFMEKIIENLGE